MANFIFDIYFTIPEIYLVGSTCILLLFGVLLSVSTFWGYPLLSKLTGLLSIQILLFTLILLFVFPYTNFTLWNFLLSSNLYISNSKIILTLACIFWSFFSINYIVKEKINSFEYWILILLTLTSFLFILQVYDLLTMYLVVELQSLSFYVLASFKRSSEFSTEAGLKYFVLGAFSSAFLLFGSSILYGVTGLTNFSDFNIFFTGLLIQDPFLLLGIFTGFSFVVAALLFKLSAAPFHMWSPDVYEGSPTSTTAFFSIFPKLVIISLLLRISFFSFYDFFLLWKKVFILCAFLSLLIGSMGALSQKRWKRFLAYSSINHIGFILIGFLSGENFSIFSIIFYLIIYIITTFSIFSFLIDFRIYNYFNSYQVRYLNSITNLAKINPALAISLSIILFSMAGIPPLSGFFAKVFILLNGVQSGIYSLVLFSILMSSVSCFYYIRIIQSMYFLKTQKWPFILSISKLNSIVLGSSSLIILLLFLDIELFSIFIIRLALSFTL